jgi:hypothetical protein
MQTRSFAIDTAICFCRNFAGMRLTFMQFQQRKVTSLAARVSFRAVKTHYALCAAPGSGLTR